MSELQQDYIDKLEGQVRELRQRVAELEDQINTGFYGKMSAKLQQQLAASQEAERQMSVHSVTLTKELQASQAQVQQLREALSQIVDDFDKMRVPFTLAELRKKVSRLLRLPHDTSALDALQSRVKELQQICRDAYEVYAGSEGFTAPTTASEAYLYQQLHLIKDEIARGLK